MKKLQTLTKILENNKECVLLEVIGQPIDLIKLGCFDGDETMFRLTKGRNHTCTVWTKDGKYYSWHWGVDGYTLVSKKLDKQGKLIEDCITKDYEIYIGDDKNKIISTLHIKSLNDIAHIKHNVKFMYWGNSFKDICCHLDDAYFTYFKGIENAFAHFKERGYTFKDRRVYLAPTGCIIEEYTIEK